MTELRLGKPLEFTAIMEGNPVEFGGFKFIVPYEFIGLQVIKDKVIAYNQFNSMVLGVFENNTTSNSIPYLIDIKRQ